MDNYPRALLEDAIAHAERRARRERNKVYVYARGGIVFVRGAGEPAPDDSLMLYRAPQWPEPEDEDEHRTPSGPNDMHPDTFHS